MLLWSVLVVVVLFQVSDAFTDVLVTLPSHLVVILCFLHYRREEYPIHSSSSCFDLMQCTSCGTNRSLWVTSLASAGATGIRIHGGG